MNLRQPRADSNTDPIESRSDVSKPQVPRKQRTGTGCRFSPCKEPVNLQIVTPHLKAFRAQNSRPRLACRVRPLRCQSDRKLNGHIRDRWALGIFDKSEWQGPTFEIPGFFNLLTEQESLTTPSLSRTCIGIAHYHFLELSHLFHGRTREPQKMSLRHHPIKK